MSEHVAAPVAKPRTYWLCACGHLNNGRWVRCMRCKAVRPATRLRLVPA
jgi:hypothetical protein